MDPSVSVSVCRLHPGVAVTGFCPACLRDRLAGLHPPSAADLRRCKSFSYARSAAAVEPQRRSCDLFRHGQPIAVAVPEEEDHHRQEPGRSHSHQQQPKKSSSLGGLLGKKLQQWRRKNKKEPEPVSSMRLPEMEMPAWHRPSCDVGPGRASWDARSGSGPMPALGRQLPASMLSLPVEEDDDDSMGVPRSDGQIPVEEDYYYYYCGNNININAAAAAAVPGGTVQTRDYYLDSSSSSRRRRSVDRSTTSGRNSFSDANNSGEATCRMMMMNAHAAANGNARVSPAAPAERLYHYHEAHHHQSVLVHHHYPREDEEELQRQGPNNLRAGDSFGSSFRDGASRNGVPASKPNKKGIKGWSIWGLISKKSGSSSSKYSAAGGGGGAAAAAAGGEYEYPWPELRARGYNGQMLRCNSSISARSSFSGTGSESLSGRRSISGVDMRDNGGGFLLERNLSTRSSSYWRSGHHGLDPAMAPQMGVGMGMQYHQQQQQLSGRPPNIPRRSSSNSNPKHEFSSLPANKAKSTRSTLGL